MKGLAFAAAAVAVSLWAAPAAAVQFYEVTVNGVLTEQLAEGVDTRFDVGDVFTLTARFADTRINGANVELYGLPTAGPEFWRIDAEGLTWQTTDEIHDGFMGLPWLTLSGSTITGMSGDLVRSSSSTVPELLLQGGATFQVRPGAFLYGNTADAGTFNGVWNFGGANLTTFVGATGVPEPAAWMLLILGFGGVGWSLRRRTAAGRLAA